jgi:hypothetical protein
LGSRIVAARQVRELMRPGFLLERNYWPYPKWFGTAFGRLELRDEPLVGSADQFADSTDVTSSAVTVRRLRHVYS